MVVEYDIELEDAHEYGGVLAQQVPAADMAPRMIAAVACFASLYFFLSLIIRAAIERAIDGQRCTLLAGLAVLAVVSWRVMLRPRRRMPRGPHDAQVDPNAKSTGMQAVMIGTLLLLGLALVVVPLVLSRRVGSPAPALSPEAARDEDLVALVGQLSWAATWVGPLLIMALSVRVSGWLMHRRIRRRHDLRHVRLEATATGLVIDGPSGRGERAWPEVVRFVESTNLFILFFHDAGSEAIPKRAFDRLGDGGVEEFRSLLRTNVHPPPGVCIAMSAEQP